MCILPAGGGDSGKAPAVPSWTQFRKRRPTPAELRAWAAERPTSWGVVTGRVSGVYVLDFDGERGRKLCKRLGLRPHVRTPSGGVHVYVAHPGHPVKTATRLLPHLDVRADGGFAVALGRGRRWLRELHPVPWEDLPDLVRDAVEGHGGVIAEGERDTALTSIAGRLRRDGLNAEELHDRLAVENLRCDPPLAERDVRRIAGSVARYSPAAGVVVRTADLAKARPTRWAWNWRIVLGSLNLLIGEESVGKGVLAAWTIARWTRGRLPGDLYRKRIHVGILGDEDSWNDVWTPRLHAAGADLERVHLIERGDGGYVDLRRDRRALTREIKDHYIRVLFLDQLLDNLGTGVDDSKQKSVRDALAPFRSLASELDIAILGALHPNKRADTFRRLVAGSGAFNAVSRSSLLLAVHPEDESRRVLVRGKGNLSPVPDTLTFSIESYKFGANESKFDVPRARRFAYSDLTVHDLVAATERPRLAAQSKQGDARALIGQLLPQDGQWHPARDVIEACVASGLDEKTAKRAKVSLGIEHRRAHTYPASVEWRWPIEGTVSPPVEDVPSVPTVPASSRDSRDSEDSKSTRPERVPSARRTRRSTREGER